MYVNLSINSENKQVGRMIHGGVEIGKNRCIVRKFNHSTKASMIILIVSLIITL